MAKKDEVTFDEDRSISCFSTNEGLIGEIHDREGDGFRFEGSSSRPLTSTQLREIADKIDKVAKASKSS